MHNRRSFLQHSATLALGGLLLPRLAGAAGSFASRPVGIQMFTMMRMAGGDTTEMFKNLAAIGFKEIETSFSPKGPFYGYKPKEFKAFLSDLGLSWRSHHVPGAPFRPRPAAAAPAGGGAPAARPDTSAARNMLRQMPPMLNLSANLQQVVDEAAEGGLPYLVCSSAPVGTLGEIKSTIDIFNRAGEACKKAGLQFAYHNHATEFDLVEGKRPYDMIMQGTDKDLVKMELDLAWAVKAKQDPVALFKEYPGRFPLWHVKDIDNNRDKITEVGNGIVDFKAAFAAAKLAGMQHFFYEQDMVQSIDSVKTSYQNIAKFA
ncbi:Sugar phosphate isomerase/epimerase [Cnuella takakiae]|uniref:Sugar phosphate isomerase/epimerase n=1 Tax=Cnuella takakiae TaxID=1302690 RepID=A0A1M5F349_9BACT|nr:sugar phosphate isomerase/epimerase [Cnuella takakiae]OLY90956.1 xylose isomerase [Cnuella takakiae]SHF85953.1 Sugar phosphate isomerase/epimerase [Cnuella takakiae]